VTRGALSTLRGGGNRSGADACLTSQTGYPAAVDFSRGFPRYRPLDGHAGERLARGEVDALIVLGSAALIPISISEAARGVAAVIIGPNASAAAIGRPIATIDTGVAGIHDAGTALRLDDVPLPVPQAISGHAAAADVIAALHACIMRQTFCLEEL
jgi:formylmethanofuran dehydrogenase subunit B